MTGPNLLTPARTVEDLLDLCRELGDIPPSRVLTHPDPTTATETDLVSVESNGKLYELVDGTLVEKAMGWEESILAIQLGKYLSLWIDAKKLCIVSGPDGAYKLFPRLIRAPDVAFVSNDRLKQLTGSRSYPDLVPDLAVEILSESNTSAEMNRKVNEYFTAGVRLVWIADPKTRTVKVYTDTTSMELLNNAQALDGGAVLPGFSLSLHEWFGHLDVLPKR